MQESAEQLMAIGQRIQNGGTLTEREREMLNSVVRAMPQMPMDPGSAVREGEMPMDPGSRRGGHKSMEFGANRGPQGRQELPSLDGMTYGPSSGVTTMDMQQMIDAGIINPNRPRPRPENLGQMRPRPRPASME
jgi:hypothetical protein